MTHRDSGERNADATSERALVERLAERLKAAGVRYCHWKSNARIAEALDGKTDLDLFVHHADSARFMEVCGVLGFKALVGPGWDQSPATAHLLGFDEASGALVHVHAYYRLHTGGGILKAFRLPFEAEFLEDMDHVGPIAVPRRGVELLAFVVRKALEHCSPLELVMLLREGDEVAREMEWLCEEPGAVQEACDLLGKRLPTLRPVHMERCIEALAGRGPRRWALAFGLRARWALRGHRVVSTFRVAVESTYRLTRKVLHRMTGRRTILRPAAGGLTITVVGGEAVGKSTVVEAIRSWLGGILTVEALHLGKPAPTAVTFLPSLALPLLRRLVPGSRGSAYAAERHATPTEAPRPSLLLMVRAVMLAHDRLRCLESAVRRGRGGGVLVVDRYPTTQGASVDGVALDVERERSRGAVRAWLAGKELGYYQRAPAPDIVIHLTVPLETALERNRTRDKPGGAEPDEFIKMRHELVSALSFPFSRELRIDTSAPLDVTLLEVKRALWCHM